jgi:hypothetical protein
MNDSEKKALCECPTDRQKPTGTPLRVNTCSIRWWAKPYGWSKRPSDVVLSGRSTGPAKAGSPRSIQRGEMASPADLICKATGSPSLSIVARSRATCMGR